MRGPVDLWGETAQCTVGSESVEPVDPFGGGDLDVVDQPFGVAGELQKQWFEECSAGTTAGVQTNSVGCGNSLTFGEDMDAGLSPAMITPTMRACTSPELSSGGRA